MPSPRIIKELKDQIYFVTFVVKNWYYIFDRHNRFKILEDSFVYCQQHKNLKIYSFVFMINHLHFIAQDPDLAGVIRDMKTHLSKEMQNNIIATEPEVLKLFQNKDNSYSFWESSNFPKLIQTEEMFEQKVNYIHYNPVRKGFVNYPEDWKWSSASKIPSKIRITDLSI
jgi:putative transposase